MIRILIRLDGSNVVEQALKHALPIAKTFPAESILLRVTRSISIWMVWSTNRLAKIYRFVAMINGTYTPRDARLLT